MTECRLCDPLPCLEWHDAAARVHAYHPRASLAPRYWAEEVESNLETAREKHKAHRGKVNWQLNMAEMKPERARKQLSPEQREKKARKARERRAAARQGKLPAGSQRRSLGPVQPKKGQSSEGAES